MEGKPIEDRDRLLSGSLGNTESEAGSVPSAI
jgi:hypothetical protein